MRRMFSVVLLTISMSGVAWAQEATGKVAEQVKAEVLKFEHEKELAMMSSTSPTNNYAADWVQRVDADDIAFTNPYGMYTKTEVVAQFKAGKHKTYSVTSSDMHVRVYGDGGNWTTAVVTYINSSAGTHTAQKERTAIKTRGTDVFIKIDGNWRWVVHHHSFLENPGKKDDGN
jgi:hypothetical protein